MASQDEEFQLVDEQVDAGTVKLEDIPKEILNLVDQDNLEDAQKQGAEPAEIQKNQTD